MAVALRTALRFAAGRGTRAVAVVALLTHVAGCDTLKQDFGDLTDALMPPTPREAAEMMFDPHDPDRRREGATWILNAPFGGSEEYLRAYRDMVQNERDAGVRAVAIRALARHGQPEDAPLIARHLQDENFHVRWEAAKGLQRLHNPEVVADLLRVLSDAEEEADVRAAAAHALGQYPEGRVFQGLVAALDARELSVNLTAERSLETLTGASLGLDPRRWLEWYNRAPDQFARRQPYVFETYSRDETIFEKLAFWTEKSWEQPAPPAGLRPASQTTTYPDSESEGEGADEAGG